VRSSCGVGLSAYTGLWTVIVDTFQSQLILQLYRFVTAAINPFFISVMITVSLMNSACPEVGKLGVRNGDGYGFTDASSNTSLTNSNYNQ
jgi:hypothetical protein